MSFRVRITNAERHPCVLQVIRKHDTDESCQNILLMPGDEWHGHEGSGVRFGQMELHHPPQPTEEQKV